MSSNLDGGQGKVGKVEAMAAPAIVADELGEVLRRCRGGERASRSRSPRARSSACSDPTAPARPPPCGCSPRCSSPTAAPPACSASTCARTRNGCAGSIGLAGQYAAVDENLTGRENLAPGGEAHPPAVGGDHRPFRRAARAVRAHRRRRPRRRARTPAGCVVASTSPPRSCTVRRCCSSTSPPPASTRRAATSSGA